MSDESVEIPRSTLIKCTNLEKFKQIDSEEFEKILHLTNKKPILAPKNDKRKLNLTKIEITPVKNQSTSCLAQNESSVRNSLVKNICSFLENKIQETSDSDLNKINSFKKNDSFDTDINSESSFTDNYNAKISISLNSLDYTFKCRRFGAFEHSSNNNNNNNEEKKDEKSKSKSKDKHRDKERSNKSKTNDSERRKRSKSNEKEKHKSGKSHTKIDQNEKVEKKEKNKEENLKSEQTEKVFNNINSSPELRIEIEDDKHSNKIQVQGSSVVDEPLVSDQVMSELSNNELGQEIQKHYYSENELEQDKEDYIEYSEVGQNINSNSEEQEMNQGPSDIMNQGRLSNATSSYSDFKNSVNFSTSTKKLEDNFKQNLSLQTANKVLQYISSFISVTTPENKNLWLSLIEKTGDSIIDILTMKDDENRNIWLTWLKDQCTSLDQLSKDLINDIEAKILRIEYKNY